MPLVHWSHALIILIVNPRWNAYHILYSWLGCFFLELSLQNLLVFRKTSFWNVQSVQTQKFELMNEQISDISIRIFIVYNTVACSIWSESRTRQRGSGLTPRRRHRSRRCTRPRSVILPTAHRPSVIEPVPVSTANCSNRTFTAMATRFCVKSLSELIPGNPNDRRSTMANFICQFHFSRDFNASCDGLQSVGQFAVDGT